MLENFIKGEGSKTAYKIGENSLSYQELIEKAKYYGELLKKEGNNPVICYGHKSIDMFISIFSCIYAKRPYIPIDIFMPKDRLNSIIEQSNAGLFINNTDKLFSDLAIKEISLANLEEYKNHLPKTRENNICYIMFTSGSTGNAKAVPISYDNLINFTKWISGISPLGQYKNINVLNQASFSFDLSVSDIFYSLYNGHKIIALDRKSQENYNEIFSVLANEEINLIVATPTFIKLCLLNNEFNSTNYPHLQCIYFCGEQLENKVVEKMFIRFPNVKIINAYGPTEATSAVSALEITKEMLDFPLLPVGKIGNFATNISIKNNEIVLSGKSLSTGYLNTQSEKFVKINGENYFFTGDIGYIKDDFLFCQGRIDRQIKYKGYRIELDDIENNLLKINGVKNCAIIAKYQNDFNVKLIKAFVELDDKTQIEQVKEELKMLLPDYMQPKTFIVLDKIPINNNGKINRKELENL